jgi:Flp pilus assembly protein TadD
MTRSGDQPRYDPMANDTAVTDDAWFAAELARGVQHYRTRAYDEAVDIFHRLAQRQNDHPAVLCMLGLCSLRSGKVPEGVQLLARAHALAPTDPETRLHYGIALLAAGRASDAVLHFRTCLPLLPQDRAPNMPETHYTLGLAELAAGALKPAAMAFDKATTLAPAFAEAWVNLGIVLYRLGNVAAARQAMLRALAAKPGHPAATANLAVFLRLMGEVEQSEALLRQAVARDGDTAASRVNLAIAQLAADQPAEALSLLDGSPPPEPRLALHWRLQRALALLELGRVDEARILLDGLEAVPAALMPLLRWRQVLLALADRDLPTARTAAARMADALEQSPDLLPEDRIMACFDLARFWSSQDDHDQAFALWADGHRQLARFQPFSRPDHLAFIEASMRQFDRARLHAGSRSQSADPAPVFIVGMPRSGTTLVEQILSAHREVHAAGERNALALTFEALGGAADSASAVTRVAGLGAEAFEEAAASYLAELHALAPDATRIVDKMPGNFRYLGLTALILPGARIIQCIRDPRDIALSIFTFRFYGYHPYAHDIADLGWYIAQYWRLMGHWRAVLPNPMLTIRLQDWVEDFDGTLRRLLDFLDLPFDSACERFYEVERKVLTVSRRQVRLPVNARGLGRWRNYARQLEPMIEELRRAGIDPDQNWTRELLGTRT